MGSARPVWPVGLRFQTREDATLGRRADAGHALQRALARDPAEVVGSLDVERGGDLEHPLRRDAQEAAEADQFRPRPAPELLELCDRPALRELVKARRDSRADSAQLAVTTRADEVP